MGEAGGDLVGKILLGEGGHLHEASPLSLAGDAPLPRTLARLQLVTRWSGFGQLPANLPDLGAFTSEQPWGFSPKPPDPSAPWDVQGNGWYWCLGDHRLHPHHRYLASSGVACPSGEQGQSTS